MGASMTEVVCRCGCGRSKQVRVADVNRGWGKFYSKSCKARHQTRIGSGRRAPAGKPNFQTLKRAHEEGRISDEYYADVVTSHYPEYATARDYHVAAENDVHPFSSEALGQD